MNGELGFRLTMGVDEKGVIVVRMMNIQLPTFNAQRPMADGSHFMLNGKNENGLRLTSGVDERGVVVVRMMNIQHRTFNIEHRMADGGHFYGMVQGMRGLFNKWGFCVGVFCILIRMGASVGFRSSTQPTIGRGGAKGFIPYP